MNYAALLLSLISVVGWAADSAFEVVPAQSTVTFHGSSTLHDFDGTAKIARGVIDLTPGQERGRIEIDATSMATGNSSRDEEMHGKHMLSATHKSIVFTLTTLQREGATTFAVGTWDMHGVSRTLKIPVTLPEANATAPRLRTNFPVDIRDWGIPVPGVAVFISVDPKIQVAVDLALAPTAAAPLAAAPVRSLGDLALPDQHGTMHPIGREARARLVMYFIVDERVLAKRCDGLLSARLGAERPLIRVIDGRSFQPEDRPTLTQRLVKASATDGTVFLLDWEGVVAKQLALPPATLQFLGFAADGSLTGEVIGDRRGATLGRALALVGIDATPPFTDAEVNPASAVKGVK